MTKGGHYRLRRRGQCACKRSSRRLKRPLPSYQVNELRPTCSSKATHDLYELITSAFRKRNTIFRRTIAFVTNDDHPYASAKLFHPSTKRRVRQERSIKGTQLPRERRHEIILRTLKRRPQPLSQDLYQQASKERRSEPNLRVKTKLTT